MNAKNVKCPWLAKEMKVLRTNLTAGELGLLRLVEEDVDEARKHSSSTITILVSQLVRLLVMVERLDAACSAALRTPSNLPLTKEQVMALPADAAVWVFDNIDRFAWVRDAGYINQFLLSSIKFERDLVFSAKPSAADIEAARLMCTGEGLGKEAPCPNATEERHE